VDDARFNLRYHVRHSRLPRPGDERVLKRTCARILEQRLDLGKPLWELWLVEGLEGGRVALVNKIHHCMVDGVSGADIMSVLMTPEPQAEIESAPVWLPRRGPTAAEYAASETTSRLLSPLDAVRTLGRIVTDEGHARSAFVERIEAAGRVVSAGVARLPATPLNRPIGPHRRFDWLPMGFDDIQFIRSRLGGTVNDVVLAIVAGAVRHFFKHVRLTDPDDIDFRVMAPVSMREAHEHSSLGNRVSAWFVPLPIGERDPLQRLARVRATTAALKQRHEALGAETITQVVEWLGALPIALGARLVERSQPPFHMVVTNVPGPRVALHLLGARMLEAYPIVPLMGQLSLGIALFSYGGMLSWGFAADWDLVPDLHEFVLGVQRSFDRLLECAHKAPEPSPAPARAKRRRLGRAAESR
jgi:WS/DGAT/MGAT family acyltransferase